MLNRRKQLQDSDNQIDSERESLLGNAYHNPDNSVYNQFPQARVYENIVDHSSTRLLSNPADQLPASQQRFSRDRSFEDQQSHLVSRNSASNLVVTRRYETPNLGVPIHTYSGETYELSETNSRAITIGSTDPYRHQQDFIYYTVQPGDTLQNLSVKYSCPVASLKRLNNLWSDQEFYGLSKLKLPVGKLRLIADAIDEERTKSSIPGKHEIPSHPIQSIGLINQFPVESTSESSHSWQHDNVHNTRCNLIDNPIFEENFTGSSSSDSIFKNLDLNIAKARTAARSYDDNASAIFQSLVESGNIVVEEEENDPNIIIARREAETLLNDMSDYGLTYSGLILFIFIVCLIFPLAYVIYLEETHHDSNKTPSHN